MRFSLPVRLVVRTSQILRSDSLDFSLFEYCCRPRVKLENMNFSNKIPVAFVVAMRDLNLDVLTG